jgi:hypothetical protein
MVEVPTRYGAGDDADRFVSALLHPARWFGVSMHIPPDPAREPATATIGHRGAGALATVPLSFVLGALAIGCSPDAERIIEVVLAVLAVAQLAVLATVERLVAPRYRLCARVAATVGIAGLALYLYGAAREERGGAVASVGAVLSALAVLGCMVPWSLQVLDGAAASPPPRSGMPRGWDDCEPTFRDLLVPTSLEESTLARFARRRGRRRLLPLPAWTGLCCLVPFGLICLGVTCIALLDGGIASLGRVGAFSYLMLELWLFVLLPSALLGRHVQRSRRAVANLRQLAAASNATMSARGLPFVVDWLDRHWPEHASASTTASCLLGHDLAAELVIERTRVLVRVRDLWGGRPPNVQCVEVLVPAADPGWNLRLPDGWSRLAVSGGVHLFCTQRDRELALDFVTSLVRLACAGAMRPGRAPG